MSDSSNKPKNTQQVAIPKELRIVLEAFKKKLWRAKISEAILAGIFGLTLSFLIVFLLDRVIETPQGARLAILIIGASIFAIFAPYIIHRWVYGHRYENQLARLVAQKFPHLGDRLLGVVELQSQTATKESLSPELRAAAMQDVAREISKRDLNVALPKNRHRSWLLAVIAITLTTAATVFYSPEAGNNALKRWLLPLSDTPRYTFTQLDLSAISQPLYVPYGEHFNITIPLHKQSIRSPKQARARYGSDPWVKSELVNGAYTFTIPGQRTAANLQIEADDAYESTPIEPLIRPSMQSVRASIELPGYLQRPDKTADLRSGFITALEGSQISIQASISRKLRSAHAEITPIIEEATSFQNDANSPSQPQLTPNKPSEPTATTTALATTIKDNLITSAPILIKANAMNIPLTWQGIHGLAADKTLTIHIENIQDQSPSTFIQGIERQHVMLAKDTISFEVLADDDYGIKASGISWAGDPARATEASATTGELTLAEGNPTQTELKTPFSLSPSTLGIQPQKLILRSWVEDYNPQRARAYSEPILIYILTPDEHAQVLKNDFDRIIGNLEDIAREEQKLNDENLRLERKEDKHLQTPEGLKKLQDQQEAERANKERMKDTAENMEKLFKDAVRNGEIDKKTLQKMSKALDAMKELAQETLPKVEQKLQEAQDTSNAEKKSKEDLQEAIKEQQKALEQMQQALKESNEANDKFEAGTFVNRLKRAASDENNIASTFISMINQVIGSSYDELDPAEQRSIKALTAQQKQTAADVRWIQEDLLHYFQRTQKEEHQNLSGAMQDSGINEALEKLSQKIKTNTSYNSIQDSKKWANQLTLWAKELKDSGAGGEGGGGSGAPPQEDQDFEFMLKIMRMIQTEQGIRSRTRALEDLYRVFNKTAPEAITP